MIIKLDNDRNIISVITVGGDPSAENSYEVHNVPQEILDDIFSYKYIDDQFVKKENIDFLRLCQVIQKKIDFLSETCHSIIENGIQIGDVHYSLTATDQMNLSKLASQAMITPEYPLFYHADGELCRQYTPEEILTISQVGVGWVTYHTTYFNYAKAYVSNLTNIQDIIEFKYGSTIRDSELDSHMRTILQTTGIDFREEIEDPFDYDEILHPSYDIREVNTAEEVVSNDEESSDEINPD